MINTIAAEVAQLEEALDLQTQSNARIEKLIIRDRDGLGPGGAMGRRG